MDMDQACLKGMDSPPQSAEEKSSKDAAQKAKGPRKRTKTGCLTCRKRRIKCGEEKPRCNNCIKSKRECEGYGQRVVFRHPVGPIPHLGPIRQIQGMGGMPGMPIMAGAFGHSMQQHIEAASASRPALLPIAPRPSYHHAHPDELSRHHQAYSSAADPYAASTQHHSAINPDQPPYTWDSVSYSDGSYIPTSSAAAAVSTAAAGSAQHYVTSTSSSSAASYPSSEAPYPHQEYAYEDTTAWEDASQLQPYEAAAVYQAQLSLQGFNPPSSIVSPTPEYVRHDHVSTTTSTSTTAATTYTTATYSASSATLVPKLESKEALLFPPAPDANDAPNQCRQQHSLVMHDVGEESDDYYDVESDEELGDQFSAPSAPSAAACHAVPGKGSLYYPSSALAVSNPPFASYMNYDNLLATYRPSPLTSPLIDPEVAKLFSHFIGSIGTIISIFERKHSIAPLLSFSLLPTEQQSLFTYTLPTLALENHGLLHSILALSSVHLAYTTGQSSTAAFRHYHFALRRISKAVGLPHRRKQIPTLAATLLLGFFEVLAAEHSKWCSHVAGASQLIREIDFASTTRRIRAMRARARKQKSVAGEKSWTRAGDFRLDTFFENDIYAPIEREIDVDLVSAIMGRDANYDALPAEPAFDQPLTVKDIEDHRIRTDLYWHYCKQDLFQSLISGNPLLLPYEKWAQTPPRSAVGRIQTAYGTMDHLLLLLARISAFGVKDRKRKLKVMEGNGDEWRPPPSMFPPATAPGGPPKPASGPPPGPASRARGQAANQGKSPPMYGMLPAGPVKLFSGFAAAPGAGPTQQAAASPSTASSSDETDLDTRTAQAEAEWQDILAACERFEQAMGPAFAPLPPDGAPLITSPFGPALQYRTHIIGCIWGLYYMGRIILHRFHPSMPPAATMAAVVAAPRTAQYAQNIGRVAAGIPYDHRFSSSASASTSNSNSYAYPSSCPPAGASSNLNVTIAGVLHELTVCLFFAAVQYVDPAQRAWTVAMLRDISIITGSKSPIAIARGCETSWIKAAEAGRGPPHQRMVFDFDPNDVCSREGVVPDHGDDRRWTAVHRGSSISWAMGLLSIDGDYAVAEDRNNRGSPSTSTT
ncbi:hypothetical protein H112_03415 [Trichophyton rubrum D6]|uniref:Zn(2)-C6 fungal-type domain-containing protein n=2 Tax=Trichophyton rubrum TaxID=5551 RepID=A0A178EWW3_TRIRU|nr:hypothetical protein H100_03420 [Trichophyton rubrum MR850]EZF42937.1 hypothetical protein H102_03415 [Trichophyton rubrum CBS 100081]EZF53627.1 hypothetical protein H103_03424 [Trichophyton rubrum CBS 288.86]EZF64204.1 hypothetical protein H104_03409 [Trichophyton rubrum CBS 289.86]EZF85500.1 hypothetical protein H110_03421 [Trichophyton rubrum MR1448]EZG17687.1 hypothetical protein H107_03531 [Trichophyton rubrum CBS 202.88]KDB34717.1 hypothetical protein H112_03415 [Trichophyton rubrum 